MNRGSRAPVGSERDILVLQYCSKTIKTVGGNGFAPDPTVTTEACSTAPGSVAGGEGACCPTAKLHSCSQPFGIWSSALAAEIWAPQNHHLAFLVRTRSGSGAEPWPETHFVAFYGRQNPYRGNIFQSFMCSVRNCFNHWNLEIWNSQNFGGGLNPLTHPLVPGPPVLPLNVRIVKLHLLLCYNDRYL